MGKGLSPRIRVAAPTGATITGTLGGDTVSFMEKSTGVYEADVEKLGPWSLSATSGAKTGSAVVIVDDVGMFECEMPLVSTTFADNDWETVASVGAAGNGANYWSIGDTHPVTLNGKVGITTYSNKTMKMFIAHFNYKSQNGIYLMGFKDSSSGKVLGLCDANYDSITYRGAKNYTMNHWGNASAAPYSTNYGGWAGCDLRYDVLGSTNKQPSGYGSTATTSRVGYDPDNYDIVDSPVSNTLMAALPSALRENMKSFTVYTDNKGNSSTEAANVTASVDYIVLPAEYEVFAENVNANVNEGAQQEQLKFYELGNSKITYKDTNPATAVGRWERSPGRTYNYDFCYVYSEGLNYANLSSRSYALTPLLRVA